MLARKYVKLDQKDHVLTRPGMYIGSIEPDVVDTWVYSDKMEKKQIKYIPGLYKIFDEILVNAIDHVARLKSKKEEEVGSYVKNIKVAFLEDDVIEVWNDGDGIEVCEHPEHKVYIPELIFGHMLTSSNYDDNEERVIGGQNGIGAKACNIFSEFFEIETVDAVRKLSYIQRFSNNMSVIDKPVIKKCVKKGFTCLRFKPDYSRFGLTGLNEEMRQVMRKRVYDTCAVTSKEVTVWLDGAKLEAKTFEKYVDWYIVDRPRVYELVNDRWEVSACFNDFAGFEQVSFVNGIWTMRGGKHVEYIANQIVKKLTELIAKRRKELSVKPQTIKDNLTLFVKAVIVNPTFDSQSKETLTTPASKFGSKAELSDKFIEKLYKTGIVDKLAEISQALGANVLKKTDGKKRESVRGIVKLDDANWAGTNKSDQCTLILTEGDSAKTMVIAGLSKVGRDKYGVFPLRGKLLNVKDAAVKKISENEEIANIKKILGLESGKIYKSLESLRYGKVMVLCDSDVDGSHIKGLLFNLFQSLWPSLIKEHQFLLSMMTPIVKASKGSEVLSFYSLTEFERWRRNNSRGWNIKYYKGLGTSTEQEAIEYFEKMKLLEYQFTEESEEKLDLAFNKKRADDRKAWLGSYDKDAQLDYEVGKVSYEAFVDKELIHFSNYDLERSIPSMIDGFKISQRKILYACFKRNLTDKEIRVAQLAAYVSENAAYHHGETSLQGAIVGMAQDFVGSNNINLLQPIGQFGGRIGGGKDASQPRYIHTLLSDIALTVFKKEDNPLLKYLDDDGFPVEPEFYVPVLPMILVNGAIGIGTGFSTNIPCYNPQEIVTGLKSLLAGGDVEELRPWYNGFTGTIEEVGDKYVSRGIWKRLALTKVQVLELPVGFWTEDFKALLEELIEQGKIKDYESNYTHCKVNFTLTFPNAVILDELIAEEKLESLLKLTSTRLLSISNMYLFNQKGQITKYEGASDVLRAFYEVRLGWYDKRRTYLLAKLEHDMEILQNKIRFVRAVISREIIVAEMRKAELEQRLVDDKYLAVDDCYDYLIRIPIYNLTLDKVEELEAEIKKLNEVFQVTYGKTSQDMWREDLIAFETAYTRYINARKAKYDEVSAPKKTVKKKST